MKTIVIKHEHDMHQLDSILKAGPVKAARSEAKLLRPIFKAWGERLKPHNNGRDPTIGLCRHYENVARFYGVALTSENLIVTKDSVVSAVERKTTKTKRNSAFGPMTFHEEDNGPYEIGALGFLSAIPHIDGNSHKFGIWRLQNANQNIIFSTIILPDDIFDSIALDEFEGLMNIFGQIFFYTNHDPLHHLSMPSFNYHLTGYRISDHKGQFRAAQQKAQTLEKAKFSKHYETWVNTSYRLTFMDRMKDPEFNNQIKNNISKYFSKLDTIHEYMRAVDPESANSTYVYFFDLLAFSFVRLYPDANNEIADLIEEKSKQHTDILAHDFANIFSKSAQRLSLETWQGITALFKKETWFGPEKSLMQKKWNAYLSSADYKLRRNHKYSNKKSIKADLECLEYAREVSRISEKIRMSPTTPVFIRG